VDGDGRSRGLSIELVVGHGLNDLRRSPLSSQTLGGRRAILLTLGLVAATSGLGCQKVHSYEIAADTKPGWVTIEFENASCPSLPSRGFTRAISIPASRYICFSDPIDHGLAARLYYQAQIGRNRRKLEQDNEIFQEGSFAFGMGEGPCRMVGESFFFGPKEDLVQSQDFSPLYPRHHQGCDPQKLGTGHVSF
jgi:hypothetical protein